MAQKIDIYDMWLNTMSLCNVQQNGQIRPVSDFQAWYNEVNVLLFHAKAGKFQLGQQVTDELSPFHTTVIVPVTKVQGRNYGVIPYPADYEYLVDLRVIRQKTEAVCGSLENLPIIDSGGKTIKYTDPDFAQMVQAYAGMGLVEETINVVDSQRFGSCLAHPIKGPTWDSPKASQDGSGMKIAPVGVQAVVLDYFRTPASAIFGYTISNQDIVIYDSLTSTQLEWTNVIKNEFLVELVKKYASAVGNTELYQQYDNNKKQLA